VPSGKKVHTTGLAGSHGVAVAPHIVGPIDNSALRREGRLNAHGHRGAYRRPGELVIPHPLQLDGPAGQRTRDQGGVERDIVSAVVTVTAGPRYMNHVHVSAAHAQHLGEIAPQWKRALGMATTQSYGRP